MMSFKIIGVQQSSITKLNFIDLFSGAGGFSCGLEQAGLKCLLGVDFDKYAMESFEANHKHAQVYCGPIQKLSNKKLSQILGGKPIHLVVGGPPCQGFSTVGPGNPSDERNRLFNEFCRVVKHTNPLFVVMENVTGLLAKKNEKVLLSIFRKFQSLGYHMEAKVLEAQNYGTPERRRRTILIGSRINNKIVFPKSTHDTILAKTFVPAKTVGEALKEVSNCKIQLNHDLELAKPKNSLDLKRIKRIPEGKGIRYKKDEDLYFTKSLKLNINWEDLREGRFRQTKYHRLDRNKPSPTIMTHRHTYFHPVEDRYLTQREAASLQGFPHRFEFRGPLSAQWRQIGNAVPPLMGKAIGKTILKMLKDSKKQTSLKKISSKDKINGLRSKAFHYKEKSL